MIAVLQALLLAVLPLMEGGASISGLLASHTIVFAIAATVLVAVARRGRLDLAFGWEAAAGFALLVIAVLSFLGVDYRFGSFLGLWDGLMLALLFVSLAACASRPAPMSMLRAVAAVSSAVQALAVLLLPGPQNMTPSGSFANASQLAAYLDLGILLSAGVVIEALRQPGRYRRATAAAGCLVIVLDVAALLYLGARGALIALLAASTIWLVASPAGRASSMPPRQRRLRAALAGALLLLAILSGLAFLWRFERLGDPYRYDRLLIWRADLRAAADGPILGMGPGMFAQRGYRYDFPLEREMFRYSKTLNATHSSWLQALVETGAAGAAALVVLVLILLRRLWPDRDAAAAGTAGTVPALWAALLCGLVDDVMTLPAIAMTLIVLLAPRLTGTQHADLHLRFACPVRRVAAVAVGAVLALGWGRGVLIPAAAHWCHVRGMMESAIALEPYNPLYRAQRGLTAWNRHLPVTPEVFAAVHHDLSDALALDPGNTSWGFALAQLHARACFDLVADEAQVDRTVRLYRESIAMGRKDPRPHAELGALFLAFGRSEEGIEEFREALRIEPRFLGARLSLARALSESGRSGEAQTAFAAFEETRARLARYVPRNTYEADLVRVPGRLDKSP